MLGSLKPMILLAGSLTAIACLIVMIRMGLVLFGFHSMNRRDYGMASIVFTILGYPFFMQKARIYREYCLFKTGKISSEKVRESIQNSRMAYSNEGYVLMQKLNKPRTSHLKA